MATIFLCTHFPSVTVSFWIDDDWFSGSSGGSEETALGGDLGKAQPSDSCGGPFVSATVVVPQIDCAEAADWLRSTTATVFIEAEACRRIPHVRIELWCC